MFCPKCGGELKAGARFCNHCGAAVGSGPSGGQPGRIQPPGRGAGNPAQRAANPAGGQPGGYPPGNPAAMGMAPGQPPKKKKGKGWIIAAIVILIVLLLGGGGVLAYQTGLFDAVLSSEKSDKKPSDKDNKEDVEDDDSEEDDLDEDDPDRDDPDEEELEASAEEDDENGREGSHGNETSAAYGNELPDLIREGERESQSPYGASTAAAMETVPATMPATAPATMPATTPATMPATMPAAMPETISGAGGAYGQAMPAQDYILPDSSTRQLTASDLAGLTKDQLRIARNEIYARHGRKFDSQDLMEYFNSKSWYRGTIAPSDFRDNMLSQVEKDNLQVIKKAEENRQ